MKAFVVVNARGDVVALCVDLDSAAREVGKAAIESAKAGLPMAECLFGIRAASWTADGGPEGFEVAA